MQPSATQQEPFPAAYEQSVGHAGATAAPPGRLPSGQRRRAAGNPPWKLNWLLSFCTWAQATAGTPPRYCPLGRRMVCGQRGERDGGVLAERAGLQHRPAGGQGLPRERSQPGMQPTCAPMWPPGAAVPRSGAPPTTHRLLHLHAVDAVLVVDRAVGNDGPAQGGGDGGSTAHQPAPPKLWCQAQRRTAASTADGPPPLPWLQEPAWQAPSGGSRGSEAHREMMPVGDSSTW